MNTDELKKKALLKGIEQEIDSLFQTIKYNATVGQGSFSGVKYTEIYASNIATCAASIIQLLSIYKEAK